MPKTKSKKPHIVRRSRRPQPKPEATDGETAGELIEEEKTPRQPRLPGIEDPEIEELESAAEQYAGIRDQRIALNQDEHKLKEELLSLMKKHTKERYYRDGLEILVVHESETVKVKISKEHEEM